MLRQKYGMSQEDLATLVGYTDRSSVAKVEAGQVDLSASMITAFAKALHTTEIDLLGLQDDQEMYASAGLDFFRIPLYKNICCGDGGFADDNIVDYVPVPSQGLDINREHFCMFAVGDSMETMIYDGDLLVFEKTSTPAENMIGAFCLSENNATCKKYVISSGVVMLKPLNSEYDPILVNVEDIRCVGVLRKIIRDVE